MTTFLIQVIHFVTSLEGVHFGLGGSIPVLHQISQTSKRNRGGDLHIFRLLCFILTHGKALAWFCCSFNLRSFGKVFSNILIVDCVVSYQAVMAHYVEFAGYIKKGLSMLPEIPPWNSSSNPTHVPARYLHYKFLASSILYTHSSSKGV